MAMVVVHGTGSLEHGLGRIFAVVGVFDGLHRGHEYLLGELRRVATDHGARPAVITFDHHPDEIIQGAAPPLLCDPAERLERLEAAGVEIAVIETFDRLTRETPFDAWVRRIAERVELAGFLMTPESAFGYERGGTPETVAELGRTLDFDVVVVPPFTLDGAPVRSSDIRTAIAGGDLRRAERLLGRRVSVVGTVARARRDATELAFRLPVAMPPAGGYEGFVRTPGGATRSRNLEIEGACLAVTPALPVRADERLAVEFVRSAGPTGNIRRS